MMSGFLVQDPDLHSWQLNQLTSQLEDNFVKNRQSEDMKRRKLELRRYLQDILNPFYFVDLFVVGSSVNNLAYFESDADICLLFTDRPDRMDQSLLAVQLLNKVKQLISRDSRFCQIELINARVPLLKFRDIQNNINVDLNVHNIVGIRNTRLLKAYSDCDDRFPKLVLAVKRWAKSNDINSAHRKTLSSYSLALMVVHFLQVCCPPVLPCLQVTDSGTFSLEDEYTRYSLNEQLTSFKSENKESLGQLFVSFLRYFAYDFDYKKSAISVRVGRCISKSVVRTFRGCKNTATQWQYLAIEEPYDRTNTACAANDPFIFQRILQVFRSSYLLIRNKCDFDLVSPLVLQALSKRSSENGFCSANDLRSTYLRHHQGIENEERNEILSKDFV